MQRLYFIIPGQSLTTQLVNELLEGGIPRLGIHLFAKKPAGLTGLTGLTVSVMGFQPPLDSILLRALSGAVVGLLTVLLMFFQGGIAGNPVSLILIMLLAGSLLGALSAFWRDMPEGAGELRRLRKELRRDDVVMLMDLPEGRLGEVEQQVKSRHPQVRVKGTDPAGSPPFP
jgi:hypothetical protein